MKAFKVFYTGRNYSEQMYVIVKDEEGIEEAVKDKSRYNFDIKSKGCTIDSYKEVPLSQVRLSDLSLIEFSRISEMKDFGENL